MKKVIKILIVSHFFLSSGWGFLAPIFAIFLTETIAMGSPQEGAKIAGYAALIYWVLRSLFQIPISQYVDKIRGEKDDLWFMVIGTFIGAAVPLGFLFSTLPWHIYSLQVLWALSMAMLTPSRQAVFSKHLDREKEAFAWGMDTTFMGFGIGVCGALGGIIAGFWGFELIFILASLGTIISAVLLLLANKHIHPEDGNFPNFFPTVPFKKYKIFRFFKGPGDQT